MSESPERPGAGPLSSPPPHDPPASPVSEEPRLSLFSRGEGEEEEEDLGGKMTFLEHLDELRRRLLYSMAAVGVAFAVCFGFRERIFGFLAIPIARVLGGMDKLVYTKPIEPFSIWMKVSFVAGIFLAAPFVLLQVWMFIAPGLYRREKLYSLPFLLSSSFLFLAGGAFAYSIILPTALDFLINQFGAPFTPMVSAIEFFDFEVLILVGMGVIFQMPVLVAFLALFGLITPGFLWRNFRYAFLLILIVAAVVSPTADVLNLFIWSGPMVLLYLVSIVVAWLFQRRRKRRHAA